MRDVNPVTELSGPPPGEGMVSLMCEPGTLVCGFAVYRVTNLAGFMGNMDVIRDVRLRCCSRGNVSRYMSSPLDQNNVYAYPDYSETLLIPPFDTVTSLAFTLQAIGVNSQPPQLVPSTFGTLPDGTVFQSCPAGYGVSGVYTEPPNFNSVYAYCSVRCTTCPRDFVCAGNAAAAPCPLNSHTASTGASTEQSCVCEAGLTRRGSVCYCPLHTFLTPSGCQTCANNSICQGDNREVPCPSHSTLVSVSATSPGLCMCADGYYASETMGCIACPAGYYCTNNTLAQCWDHSVSGNLSGTCQCNPGFHHPPGERLCAPCPAGNSCPGAVPPEPCPSGTYGNASGLTVCTQCPPNSGSPSPGATRVSQCVCAPGFTGFPGSGLCYACSPGGYCPGFGETTVACAPGTYQTGYGIGTSAGCTPCAAGTFSRITSSISPLDCTGCALGTYQTGLGTTAQAGCRSCGVGTFGPRMGLSACDLCQVGTIQLGLGAVSSSQCEGCLAGTYQTGVGMGSLAACKQCPAGTYQTGVGLTGISDCALCGPGTYQPVKGQPFADGCLPCLAGTYQSGLGVTTSAACAACAAGSYQVEDGCEQCLPGTFSPTPGAQSSASCVACRPGAYQPAAGANSSLQCTLCPAGTYQPWIGVSSADDCLACSPGTFQTAPGATSPSSCDQCGAGTYQTGFGAAGSAECIACGPGTYQTGLAARSPLDCTWCRAGTYQTGMAITNSTQCAACPAGKYLTAEGARSSRECVLCSAGTYQTTTGASAGEACLMCRQGTYQPVQGAGLRASCTRCPVGTYQTSIGVTTSAACTSCGIGTFSSALGAYSPLACAPCPAGRFHNRTGQSACLLCAEGGFQETTGATVCSLCRAGTYQPRLGSIYGWWCSECEEGTYSTTIGASGQDSCRACAPGNYSAGTGLTTCSVCELGKYSPDAGGHLCYACMNGMFSNRTGASACIRCGLGESMGSTGQSTCSACGPGQYQFLTGSSVCFACSVGYYQPLPASTYCEECQPGYVQPEFNQSTCLTCLPGSFSGRRAGTCTACPPGQHQPSSNATICIFCPAGTFQNRSGQTGCAPCATGAYQGLGGATACSVCRSGEFQMETGASACVKCPRGTFQAGLGVILAEDCRNCSAGSYSGVEGGTTCLPCAQGLYAATGGLTACAECEPGTFQSSANASSCRVCPAGTFGAGWGRPSLAQGCLPCAPGRFSNLSGVTTCALCPLGTSSPQQGSLQCIPCAAGTYMGDLGWSQPNCTSCPAGTYSSSVGATTAAACILCDDGYFSSWSGQILRATCRMCKAGTVSVANKSLCTPCGAGLYCPAGYHVPIRCVEGLVCNGTHLDALPGILPVLRNNCTGAIPCPPGTQCATRDPVLGKGILAPLSNQTQFIVHEGGPNTSLLSCSGRRLSYGFTRVNWPYAAEDLPSPVLYWLEPTGCPAGTYLLNDACTPCPTGMYSSRINALVWDTCRACIPGTYGPVEGATACLQCEGGSFSNTTRAVACQSCLPGSYQREGASACLLCPAGSFAASGHASACSLCDAGTHQPSNGTTGCLTCGPREFSSPGDHLCSECGSNLQTLDPGATCSPPELPSNSYAAMWVSVKGADSDDCLSRGPAASPSPGSVSTSYVLLQRRTTCMSALFVAENPSLTRVWSTPVGTLQRPVALRVIPYNTTFYPGLCQRRGQGFGVLFTLADADGGMLTDLTDASATMSILDPLGQDVLSRTGCSRLPQDPNAKVPIGMCRITSFCPLMPVMVRVSLTWKGAPRPLEGNVTLSPGPLVFCPPTQSWLAAVELLEPDVPYLPGDTLTIQISHLNPPESAMLVVFRFSLRILSGVTFLSFESPFSAVSDMVGGVLSVVGDSSQGGQGRILGLLRVRLDAAVSGVALVAQVVPGAFQFTLANAVPYTMLVRTMGFSCRSDGYVDMLADYPRPTALITNVPKTTVVNWRLIQPVAQDFPAAIHVVAVGVVMHSFGPVVATCTSLDSLSLAVESCAVVRAWGGKGNASVTVQVQYQSLVTHVAFTAWVPISATFATMVSPSGMSGRYRFRVTLSASPRTITGVDATPYIPRLLGLGAVIANEQWTCSRPGLSFTIGSPTLYVGQCGNVSSTILAPVSLFVASWAKATTSLGAFTFPPAVISVATPSAALLVFSSSGTLLPVRSVAPLEQLTVRTAGPRETTLALKNMGGSARCSVLVVNTTAGLVITGAVPVFPATPVELQVVLSTNTVVRQADSTMLVPVATFVIRATLVFLDGSQLGVQSDPRLSMESDEMQVTGLGAITRETFVGDARLTFRFRGIPCVTTFQTVKVLASSVKTATLVCPSCPAYLASETDPLAQTFPWLYPSSVRASAVLVRRELFDGRILDRPEALAVSGDALALVDDKLVGRQGGTGRVTTQFTSEPLDITVLERWTNTTTLLCNGRPCSEEGLKLTTPGDGAAGAPFAYTTSLVLTLSLGLYDGRTVSYPWLPDVLAVVNRSSREADQKTGLAIPLVYGLLQVQCVFGASWRMVDREISDGVLLTVARLSFLTLQGPPVLYQVHCSGQWEETSTYSATGTLSDGSTLALPDAEYIPSGVLVYRQHRFFSASGPGEGRLAVRYGGQETVLLVTATVSSHYYTAIGLDFLPALWSAPSGTLLPLTPALTPALIVTGPAPLSALAWTSSAPDVIRVSSSGGTLVLLADSYQPVTITGALRPCESSPTDAVVSSKDVTVNVVPTRTGDLDFGQQDTGLPLVPLGGIMTIPIFVFSAERLRSYMVEIDVPGNGLEPLDCLPGVLPTSQCDVVLRDGVPVFRSVAAFSQGNLTGRLLVANVRGRVLLSAGVTFVRVSLLQLIAGETSVPQGNMTFAVRLGTGPLPVEGHARRSLPTNAPLSPGLGTPGERVYGDTDGDGLFTAMDVLFMETYMARSVYAGAQTICVVQGRCQSTSRLTEWQLLQLKPVRHPSRPASRPDGSDLLFLQLALVGKTFFLTELDIAAKPGSLAVTVGLRDFMQTPNPPNAVVRLQLVTTMNQYLPFHSLSKFDQSTSVLTVLCQGSDPAGYTARSLEAGTTVDEPAVGLRILLQSLDPLGSDKSALAVDRTFLFLPSAPIYTFNILGSNTLLEETPTVEYLPTLGCKLLCKDASLFLDQATSVVDWLDNPGTVVSAGLVGAILPRFRGFWAPFKGKMIVPDPLPTVAILSIPPPGTDQADMILVGTRFNLTHNLPQGTVMGLYRVHTALPLLAVHGRGELVLPGPYVLARGETQLEFSMDQEGGHSVRLVPLQLYPSVKNLGDSIAAFSPTGVHPSLTRLEIAPLCVAGVILWSRLVSRRLDEPCVVTVTPVYQQTGKGAGLNFTCTQYPCSLQGFGQVIRPQIDVFIPTLPRLIIQKPVVAIGQRTQWRAMCTLGGKEVTVSERALAAGLIQTAPANAIAVTPDSIRGMVVGWATINFGGKVRAGLNISDTVDPPVLLEAGAFSNIDFAPISALVVAIFRTNKLLAGTRGYLLLKAVYNGDYVLLLDPTPGTDGLKVRNASQDVVVSQIDGSFTLSARAKGGLNMSIVEVEYHGITAVVRTEIVALEPSGLDVCGGPEGQCQTNVALASAASAMHGHPSFPSSFVLNKPSVSFSKRDDRLTLELSDASVHLIYNTTVLHYSPASGLWSLTADAPATGDFTITVKYTHPGSLVVVQSQVLLSLVDLVSMDLTPSPSLVLRRVHCSPTTFESAVFTAVLRVTGGSAVPSDWLQLESSNPSVARNSSETTILGIEVGTSIITARVRGKARTCPVTVVDDSVVVASISLSRVQLRGVPGARIPLNLLGTLQGDPTLRPLSFLWPVVVAEVSAGIPSGLEQGGHWNMLGSTTAPGTISLRLPSCPADSGPDLTSIAPLEVQLVADTSRSPHADVEIVWVNSTLFTVALVATSPVLAFHIQLQTNASWVGECTPLSDMPFFSDCSQDGEGGLAIVGARRTPFPGVRSAIASIHTAGGVGLIIRGYVEVFNGISSVRYSVQAGRYGGLYAQGGNSTVALLMPSLPIVDTSALYRQYASGPDSLRDAVYTLLLLSNRQRTVDTRFYSNEFELSAMFRVMDRFLRPDTNRSGVRVLFHTEELPLFQGSTLVPGEGLWVRARHILDGWYVAEFRQKIPQLRGIDVSFTVETSTSGAWPWTWTFPFPVDMGLPAPACPRLATQTATFLASYQITVSGNTSAVLQELLARVACSVQVASRRVMAVPEGSHVIRLSVALESLVRVHQTNMVLMGPGFVDELQRRLVSSSNVSIERGDLLYINDTRDAPIPCPAGYYYTVNGTYASLPVHAVAGPDCYDMLCIEGFTQDQHHCIPTPVSSDVLWICVLIVLTVVIALSALICCVHLALWKTGPAPMVFEPSPPAPDKKEEQPELFEDIVFEDSDERETYFRNIVSEVILDDYSAMMLEGEFSPPLAEN